MPQWGKTDASSNAVSWAAETLGASNNAALFGNTTANSFVAGQTVGLFGVDGTEVYATPGAHVGWVLKREGTGGRAGRVSYETLVAMNSISGDADAGVIPDYTILFSTQPANSTANSTAGQSATFTAVAYTVPDGGVLTYQWQANTGSGFANVVAGNTYSNVTTATLTVTNTTGLNGAQYRLNAFVPDSNTATSDVAVLTVTT